MCIYRELWLSVDNHINISITLDFLLSCILFAKKDRLQLYVFFSGKYIVIFVPFAYILLTLANHG